MTGKMKRRAVFFLLLLFVLFSFVSCSESKNNLCYFGLFSDTAVMIAYNAKNNTVYDIILPYNAIVSWGIQNGTENIPNAIRGFTGAKDSGFIMGNQDTFESLRLLNSAIKYDLECLENPVAVQNLNRLCMTDISMLLSSINPETVFKKINAEKFDGTREHFASWVKQIYGE